MKFLPLFLALLCPLSSSLCADATSHLETLLTHTETGTLRLVIKNTGPEPLTFRSNIAELVRKEFFNLPKGTLVEFRDADAKSLRAPGPDAQWFLLASFSSNIDDPVFFPRDANPSHINRPITRLEEITLRPQQSIEHTFETRRTLAFAKGSLFPTATECRVRIPVKFLFGDLLIERHLETDWFFLP